MEEEELKKAIEERAIYWAKWLHNTYENVSKDQGWETQKECQVDFDKLPSKNKQVMIRMGAKLEIQMRIKKDKGFLAGQLASQEKCLKMIEEVYEDEPVYVQEVEKIINRIFDKITKKIKEMKG